MRLCNNTKKGNTESFILKAKQIYPDYDYSKTEYKNNKTHVIIGCMTHGDFLRTPNVLLNKKNGCPACSNKKRWTIDYFIEEANKIHNNLYDYSLVEIKNSKTKIKIICIIHGIFEQDIGSHIYGKCGCPKCASESSESKAVKSIKQYFNENNIVYEQEKKFDDCKNINFLPFDFYIEQYNLLIEYDGEFHFKSWNNDLERLHEQQKRDTIKTKYALENGYNFLRVSFTDDYLDIIKNILVESSTTSLNDVGVSAPKWEGT